MYVGWMKIPKERFFLKAFVLFPFQHYSSFQRDLPSPSPSCLHYKCTSILVSILSGTMNVSSCAKVAPGAALLCN